MAIREIRLQDDEILRKKSRIVENVDDKIREILRDMDETMKLNRGVGISAVQVGILKRLVVINIEEDEKAPSLKLVNPEIIKQKGTQEVEEGCLSFPQQYAKVVRPNDVTVKALDENGKPITIKGKGLLAQALCHEIDHLDGKLFVDIMEPGTLEFVDNTSEENN